MKKELRLHLEKKTVDEMKKQSKKMPYCPRPSSGSASHFARVAIEALLDFERRAGINLKKDGQ